MRNQAHGSYWALYFKGNNEAQIYWGTPYPPLGVYFDRGSGTSEDPYVTDWNYDRANGTELSVFHPGDRIKGVVVDAKTSTGITFVAASDKWVRFSGDDNYYPLSATESTTFTGLTADTQVYVYGNYKIVYNGNGNTGGSTSNSESFPAGSDGTIAENGFVKELSRFKSWNTKADGSGIRYYPGDHIVSDESVTLYAQWELYQYKITYDGNGNDSGYTDTTITEIGTEAEVAANEFRKTSYKFNGWNTERNGSGESYAVGDLISDNTNRTLYAQWIPSDKTFTFSAPGTAALSDGWNSAGSISVSPGEDVFPEGNKLVVSAESENGWNVTLNTTQVSYGLKNTENGSDTTVWEFTKEDVNNGKTYPLGIQITVPDDLAYGIYSDTITFKGEFVSTKPQYLNELVQYDDYGDMYFHGLYSFRQIWEPYGGGYCGKTIDAELAKSIARYKKSETGQNCIVFYGADGDDGLFARSDGELGRIYWDASWNPDDFGLDWEDWYYVYAYGIPSTAVGAAAEPFTTEVKTLGTMTVTHKVAEPATVAEAPVAVEDLTYTGDELTLITAGSTTEGTMQYTLGTDDSTVPESGWSEKLPTGIDAGTYYVWYKVNGDENHNDSTPDSVTVTVNKKDVTVDGITASDKSYDGNTTATLDTSNAMFTGKLDGDTLTVTGTGTFDNANVGENKTITISDLTLGGESAGNYQLAAEGQQTSTTASITPNTLNIVATEYTGTYDGQAHSISVTTEETGVTITYAESEEGTYSQTNPVYTEAGTHTVYYKAEKTGSTTVSGSKNVTINQKAVTVSGITASDKIYDGSTEATLVTTAVILTGKLDGDTLTVTGTGTFDNANVGENKTVTISDLRLDGTGKDNYVLATEGQQATATAAITAKEVGLTWGDTELTYTGVAQKPTATATGLVDGDTCTVIVTGEQTNVGDGYTATAESLSNSNYKLPENKTAAFKIDKAAPPVFREVWKPVAKKLVYNGEPQELVTAPQSLPEGYQVEYSTNGTDWNTEFPKKTNAGDYTVKVRYIGDDNHEGFDGADIPVTIQKGSGSEALTDAQKPVAKENLKYTGEPQDLVTAPESAPTGYTVKYSVDNGITWTETVPKGINAGPYTVKVKYIGDSNRADFDGEDITVTIGKKDAPEFTDEQKPAPNTELIYSAEPQELVRKPAERPNGYDKVLYRLSDTEDWKEDVPIGTNAGTYNVQVKYVGDSNHEDFIGDPIKVTIAKANVTVTANDKSKTYGQEDPILDATVTGLFGSDTVEYTVAREEGESVRTYTITPSGEVTQGNYTVTYETGTFNITSKSSDDENITAEQKDDEILTYTGESVKPTIIIKDGDKTFVEGTDYTITYVGIEDTNYPGTGDGKLPPTNAGKYKAIITFKGNYTGTRNVTFDIGKASPDVKTLPTVSAITYGQKLSDSTITGGEMKGQSGEIIDGKFTWENGDVKPTVADSEKTEYTFVFTPAEDANYEPVNVKVKVKVNKFKEDKDKLTNEQKPTAKEELTYNGNEQILVNPPETLPDGYTKVQYRLSDEDEWSDELPKGKAAGTYKVQVKYIGDENHVDFEGDVIDATISPKTSGEDITVKQEDDETLTYTGEPVKPSIVITDGTDDNKKELVEGTDYTVTYEGIAPTVYPGVGGDNTKAPTNAGKYKAVITYKDNYTGEKEVTFDIEKSSTEIQTLPTISGITYGQKLSDTTITDGEVKGASDKKVEGTFTWKDGDVKPTVADSEKTEYTLIFTPKDTNNYVPVEAKVKVKVNGYKEDKDKLNGNQKPTAIEELIYNGEDQILVNPPENLPGGYTKIQYRLSDEEEWSDELPKGKDAGTYKVQVKYIGDENHVDFEGDVIDATISPKTSGEDITAKQKDNEILTYTGKPVKPTIIITDGTDDNKKELVEGTDYTVTYEGIAPTVYPGEDGDGTKAPTNAGTYKAVITFKDNYTGTKEVEFTIAKSGQEALDSGTFTTTNEDDAENTNGKIDGFDKEKTYQYSSDDGKTWTDVPKGAASIDVKAGTYKIRFAGDDNHEPSEAVKVTVGIASRTEGVVNFNKDDNSGSETYVETVVEEAKSSNIKTFAESQVEEGKDVKVELEITPKKEDDVDKASVTEIGGKVNEVFAGIETESIVTEYLQIDLAKYVDNAKEGNISDTKSPLEIELTYDETKAGNPIVVRTHNGKAKAFGKLNERPKADFKDATYHAANGKIYLYSQYFSDFAIVYSTKKTYYVNVDLGNGDTLSQVVGENSKLDLPTGLTKEGFAFGGWYKDAEYNNAWDVDKDTVTGDISIYGKWNKSVTGVKVDVDNVTFAKVGESTKLNVSVTPSDAADKKVTFTSSDPKVVTVDENGNITAVANGTATITITTEDGAKTATVNVTVAIPDVDKQGTTDQQTVEPTKEEKAAISMNAGLKISQTGSKINIKWGKVKEADGYDLYVTYCGESFAHKKPAKTFDKNTTVKATITKINGKKINLKKNFKLYVAAYKMVEGKKEILAKTITGHVVGRKNTKYSNAKNIKITSKTKVSLKQGKTSKIKAKTILVEKGKKQLSDAHAKEFRYASSNNSIATVDKNGKIKGIAKGTCTVYVYSRNGYAKKVSVTVK